MKDQMEKREWTAGDKVKVFTSKKGYAKGVVSGYSGNLVEVTLKNGMTAAFHASRVRPDVFA